MLIFVKFTSVLEKHFSDLPSGTKFTLGKAQTSGTTSWSCSSDSACKTSRVYTTNNSSYGNLYSWYTATANTGTYSMSSGNASGSICPQGWRLPTGNTTGELQALYEAYNSNVTSFISSTSFVFAGYYDGGVKYKGSYGYWWSSTIRSRTSAYLLNGTSSRITPASDSPKYSGYSIRCLAPASGEPNVILFKTY